MTPIHGAKTNADMPAIDRTRKISSGAYATDERASDAKTGKAIRFGNRVWPSVSLRNGLPNNNRFVAVESWTLAKRKPSRGRSTADPLRCPIWSDPEGPPDRKYTHPSPGAVRFRFGNSGDPG